MIGLGSIFGFLWLILSWKGGGGGKNRESRNHWLTHGCLVLVAAKPLALLPGPVAGRLWFGFWLVTAEAVVRVQLPHVVWLLLICISSLSGPVNVCWMRRWRCHLSKCPFPPLLPNVPAFVCVCVSTNYMSLFNVEQRELPHWSQRAHFKRKQISLPK